MVVLAWLGSLLINPLGALFYAGIAYLLVLLILPPRHKRVNIPTEDAVGQVYVVLVFCLFSAMMILAGCALVLLVGVGIGNALGLPVDKINIGGSWHGWRTLLLAYGAAYLITLCIHLFQIRRLWSR